MGNDMNKWKRKNLWKVIRAVLELVGVAVLFVYIGYILFWEPEYQPYEETLAKSAEDAGFVALSYFGVEKFDSDSSTLIDQKRLDEHLKALYESGYVTISQQDILDYYAGKKKLPEKSLFLMFEDGRRDTAIFAEEIMEKYNFLATMGTYAENIVQSDTKFLSAKDLLDLEEGTFWEMGVNGYRLEYINVFDQYENYFGELDSNEFAEVSGYLIRDYDHYLMDFIRDQDRVPMETREELQDRIRFDYEQTEKIYTEELGELPAFYVLMHSNTGAFGTNEYASKENAEHIYEMFAANFNWEGTAQNKLTDEENSLYQLTRLQPQENWYTNHLLMRLQGETKQQMAFTVGDEKRSADWLVLDGAAEFKDNDIVLTSPVSGEGRMLLKDRVLKDGVIEAVLKGNVAGAQSIYVRADETNKNSVGIRLVNNVLSVTQRTEGVETELYALDLFEFDGGSKYSEEEVELQGLIAKEEALIQYEKDEKKVQEARARLEELKKQQAAGLEEGAEGYVPMIDLKDKGERVLTITLEGDYLTLAVDEQSVVKNLKVQGSEEGLVYLIDSPLSADERFSQRNLTDTVYDGVFSDLHIVAGEDVVYSNRLNKWEKAEKTAQGIWISVVNWFIEYL